MIGAPVRTALAGALTLLALTAGASIADAADESVVIDGIIALEDEVMLLVELGSFPEPARGAVAEVHAAWAEDARGLTRDELLEWLDDADRDGTSALDALMADDEPVSPALAASLGPLASPDLAALARAETIDADQAVYAQALEDLWDLDIDLQDASAAAAAGPTWTALAGAVGLVAVGIGIGVGLRRRTARPVGDDRGRDAPADDRHAGSGDGHADDGHADDGHGGRADAVDDAAAGPVDGATFDRLLDASRRMTGALQTEQVIGIAVDEASELTDARAGAFVRVRLAGPNAGFEVARSPKGLLNAERLSDGMLRRVAETGQTARLVAYDEPALASLPVSLLAVPVIWQGQVVGVLVVVREVSRPFGPAQESALRQLAPMAASALRAAEQHGSVTARSLIDGLTGLPNRRCLDEQLPAALAEPGPRGTLAVAMVDIDHFKAYNDRQGHAAGDRALVAVAAALRAEVREFAYRYGGEEFTIVLQDVTGAQAEAALERVRVAVERTPVDGAAEQPLGAVTVSIGAVVVTGSGVDAATALHRADEQLYAAKHAGRNRVIVTDLTGAAAAGAGLPVP